MNQGKLEVIKLEITRMNLNILGINELRWTGMGEFNSDDHYIYYCGQESLRRNGLNIPGSYAILLFTASDFASITSHIHNWVLFLLWLCLFTLSEVISPLISSSILPTPVFLPGKSHGQRSLAGYSPWGHNELDRTE